MTSLSCDLFVRQRNITNFYLYSTSLVLDGDHLYPVPGVVCDGETLADSLQLLLEKLSLGFPLTPADGEILCDLVAGVGRRLKFARFCVCRVSGLLLCG